MKERIIILGAGVMQGPAIRIAKELGLFTIVIDGSSAAPCIPLADQFEQIDLKDKEGIEAFARSLQNSDGLGGIMTAGTDFSASVAWTAEKLGLPGIPYEAALNASDKSRMRGCFQKAGLPSPDFITITALDTAGADEKISCPLVIKPVDNMGGRGCRRVNRREEFPEAAADALRFSRSGRAIVETFMDGPEFSVDAIVYHGEIIICGLADRHIFFPPYFIEMGHTIPTNIETEKQEVLLETFRAGIRSLGLAGDGSIGAAKGDVKLTPSGPMLGEIAARLSGGYMSGWTYPFASGVEPVRAAILAAMGQRPDNLAPQKNWTSAERAFISIPGTVKSIAGIEEAKTAPHIRELFLRAGPGEAVNFPENNVSKCGNLISAAPSRAEAVEAAASAARSVLIRLDPEDSRTGAFLSSTGVFPPDAFNLSPGLRSALSLLPETVFPETGGAPSARALTVYYRPFPEFISAGLRDYMGRTAAETLEAVRRLTALSLPEAPETTDNNSIILGKSFWAALVRGGYQGAVYYIDQLETNGK